MAKYNSLIITDAGREIIFAALAGNYRIRFTAMAFGAGEHADDENLAALTQLSDERQRVDITDAVTQTLNSVIVKASIDNSELQSGYRVREIGIFCQNADDAESEETLYAVITAEIPDYMPTPAQNSAPVMFSFQFGLSVNDASEVTIIAGGDGYYTQAEINELFTEYYTQADINELFTDYYTKEQIDALLEGGN